MESTFIYLSILLIQHVLSADPTTCYGYTSLDGCVTCVNSPLGCGWCPTSSSCMDKSDSASCVNSASGQWSTNTGDCQCLDATSCQDMVDNDIFYLRGWCPSRNQCYQGNGDAPYDGIECVATIEDGQWSKNENDCKCLTATTCEDMYTEVDLFNLRGWCPYHGKCYKGNGDGPYDNIECPANETLGQWSYYEGDCKCLAATSCEDLYINEDLLYLRGWCPSRQKCYKGNSAGPYDDIPCDADEELGQWSHTESDCKCLNATTCQDMVDDNIFTSKGWCVSKNKCYQGSSHGPSDPLECLPDGDWIEFGEYCRTNAPSQQQVPTNAPVIAPTNAPNTPAHNGMGNVVNKLFVMQILAFIMYFTSCTL